jgi:menaquinone-dependent protoporphyrinogen oxidase
VIAADAGRRAVRDGAAMTNVLVVYGSKHGSTAEIAAAIAETLRESGLRAHCLKAAEVSDVGEYDAVVLGSAVYMRRWRREARRFLHKHASDLAQRPFWVFSSGPVGDPAKDNAAWLEPGRTIAEVERLGAREHVVFGGRSESSGIPEEFRDRRDWDEIREWARGIAAELPVAAGR